MSDRLDESREQVISEMRKVYSEKVIEHAMNPKNVGNMPDADAYAYIAGPCGDNMEMWLKIRNGMVIDASFWTNGCGTTIACGSLTTELAKGKTLGEALAINASAIVRSLGGLPEESVHCAGLASTTLKKAIIEYMNLQKEPWKRAYKKG